MDSYNCANFADVIAVLGRENPSITVRRVAATQVRQEPEAWQVLARVTAHGFDTHQMQTAATLEEAFDKLIGGLLQWAEIRSTP